MSWHVTDETIEAYAQGRIDDASAFSLEAHVLACAPCRADVAAWTAPSDLADTWRRIAVTIERPRGGVGERALRAAGVSPHLARLLTTGPRLGLPWFLGVAVALTFAVIAARADGDVPRAFLILAPLVPLGGVAVAFGRDVDPVWEVALTTPIGGFRLTLIRTASVLVTSIGLAGLAAIALPGGGEVAVVWLLPSLALTLLALAVSSIPVSTVSAATVIGAAWAGSVLVWDRLAADPLAAFHTGPQTLYALIAVASAAIVLARHRTYERPPSI